MTTFDAVACTACGCVCDDLRVTTDGTRVVAAERACRLSEPWLLAQAGGQHPEAFVGDRPATVAEAVARAADLLRAARRPLVTGLGRCTTAGLRAAVALADRLGAVIDPAGDPAATVAFQQAGQSTCTLGEVRQRADLVLFWGCDPVTTHPRLIERYIRPDAELVAVGTTATPTARQAGRLVRVTPGRDWEALWTLRQLAAGHEPRADADTGASLTELRPLAERVAACRFGVIFFDGMGHRTVEALLRLVTDLNRRTRFYARELRPGGAVAGAGDLLAWQTGYPFGVDLARGFPRSNAGEFTAPHVLARGEADVCLLVGSESVAGMPPAAVARLGTIPVIALDPPGVAPLGPAAVRIATAVYGVHRPGTAHRLDGVSLPLRPLLPTNLPDDGEVLGAILAVIGTPAA